MKSIIILQANPYLTQHGQIRKIGLSDSHTTEKDTNKLFLLTPIHTNLYLENKHTEATIKKRKKNRSTIQTNTKNVTPEKFPSTSTRGSQMLRNS